MPSRRAQRRDGHTRTRTDYLERYVMESWAQRFDAWLVSKIRPVDPPAAPATPEGNKE